MADTDATHPNDGSPGSENSPLGGESSGRADAPLGIADRVAGGVAPPPGSNQGKTEPMDPRPRTDGDTTGADASAEPTRSTGQPASPVPSPGADPGSTPGVSVPGVQSARGTSEDLPAASPVPTTSLAPPGRPDGEVDTRG